MTSSNPVPNNKTMPINNRFLDKLCAAALDGPANKFNVRVVMLTKALGAQTDVVPGFVREAREDEIDVTMEAHRANLAAIEVGVRAICEYKLCYNRPDLVFDAKYVDQEAMDVATEIVDLFGFHEESEEAETVISACLALAADKYPLEVS